jgi:hypothetical protein
MKTLVIVSTAILATLVTALSSASGFRWHDHADPYSFLFGNHIDTHQETRLNIDGSLDGFFYVVHLDQDGDGLLDTTEDGTPIKRHCTKPEHYPTCEVGWHIRAVPCVEAINGCTAMFLFHRHDHPVWLIGPYRRTMEGETFLSGSRAPIPQPGSPGHVHWLTEGLDLDDPADGVVDRPSSLAELEALLGVDITVPEACNVDMASQLTTGVICPVYFLEIRAVDNFYFHHGGENIPVRPGIDLSTHINYVTSYVAVDVPAEGLPTRPGGGMGGMGGDGHGGGEAGGH